MKNIVGTPKKHKLGYEYLSLLQFPSGDIKHLITSDLIQKSNYAQFLLGKLSGITILLPDVDYFINSYVMKDATSSSQIEGTKATMIDALESVADPSSKSDTDADDITHYVKAMHYGLRRLGEDQFPFSLRFIRELHRELMQSARSTHFANPGEFRESQNWIGGTRPDNASYVPPSPEELDRPLNDLEKFIHEPCIHPILDAGLLHAQFETIHPFLDGNGRTGRLLIIFYLIHYKFLELPVLFLSSYFKEHQKVYYQRLNEYHDGNIIPWLDFFVDALTETAKQAIEISKKVTLQRDKDLSSIAKLSKKTSNIAIGILQKLYKDPIVSSTTIREWIGQTKPGTLKFINKLIEADILVLHRRGEGVKPALYAHRDYLAIFTDK